MSAGQDAAHPAAGDPQPADATIAWRRHNAVVSSVWDGVRERVIDAWGNTSHYTPSYCLETYGAVLAPQMTPEELADLETWLGVSLPREYRSFLLEVSAGGIYVFPVQRGAQLPDDYRRRASISFNFAADGSIVRVRPVPYDEWEWVNQPSGVDPSLVIQPFSTVRADDETWMVMCGAPPAEEDFGDPDEFQHAFDEWCLRASHRIMSRHRTAGTIQLAEEQQHFNDYLVVTGPARGQMWRRYWDHSGEVDMFPIVGPDGAPATFARWYLEHLNKTKPDDQRPLASSSS
jgi:hypothetical protein